MLDILYKELSYKIIGLAMEVQRELGYGFLEKVYENALVILLDENNIKVEQQKQIIKDVHKAQVANYLKATGKKLGIIINFGSEKLEFERVVM